MDGPLVRPDGAQTIDREVDTFADAHAGMTDKQQGITGEVIAAQQFPLDQLILFRGQWARQTVLPSGNIIRDEQVGQRRNLLGPGKFFQHASQVDYIPGASVGSPWRVVQP